MNLVLRQEGKVTATTTVCSPRNPFKFVNLQETDIDALCDDVCAKVPDAVAELLVRSGRLATTDTTAPAPAGVLRISSFTVADVVQAKKPPSHGHLG